MINSIEVQRNVENYQFPGRRKGNEDTLNWKVNSILATLNLSYLVVRVNPKSLTTFAILR